jgi:predicted nucleic acid-binding protein
MIYVFDSSFISALIIPDEKNTLLSKMYDKIEDKNDKYVPQLLWYEIANIFRNLVLRKRFTFDEVMQFFPLLAAFRLTSDQENGTEYSKKILRLCNDYMLSSYDAAYLELAERKNAKLCTLDESLQTAAKKCGVTILE